jgi:two-component system chemotaxis response regulator CheY
MAFNILIVDDSPAMRRVVRRVVDIAGVNVGKCLEAANGVEALVILRSDSVDLVMTDINMPDMNGEQLLVVSTDRSEARTRQMISLGADGYVSKPFLPATLSHEMFRLLGGTSHESL